MRLNCNKVCILVAFNGVKSRCIMIVDEFAYESNHEYIMRMEISCNFRV